MLAEISPIGAAIKAKSTQAAPDCNTSCPPVFLERGEVLLGEMLLGEVLLGEVLLGEETYLR